MPVAGGRPRKEAALAGMVLTACWGADGTLAFLGIDHPGSPEWANVGLFLSHGRRQERLAADHDLNIWNTTFGDLVDWDNFIPPALAWLDAERVLALVADRGASHPYRFGVDGSIGRLAAVPVGVSPASSAAAASSSRGRPAS